MGSEEDMHDANDVQSVEDDFYTGETGMGSEDDDYNFGDNYSDDSEDVTSHRQQVRGCKKDPYFLSFLVSFPF